MIWQNNYSRKTLFDVWIGYLIVLTSGVLLLIFVPWVLIFLLALWLYCYASVGSHTQFWKNIDNQTKEKR